MPIIDIFSKRQRRLRGEMSDVYSYDALPDPLRVQIVHILNHALGGREEYGNIYNFPSVRKIYKSIVDVLCREYGVFRLPGYENQHNRIYIDELVTFFLKENDIEKCLDVIEMTFRAIDIFTRDYGYMNRRNASSIADDAINELNQRFKEHGVGYHFENRKIMRIDSQLIHSEVVKPALSLISQRRYAGVQEEFLKAHEHYRSGNAKESLNECLKALESMMKTICDERGWNYGSTATAKALIKTCFDNQIVPPFWQQHFSSLRSLLEAGVPTGRNKLSSHGQGAVPTSVPNFIVGYALHMTAAAIVFLAKAADQVKR